MDSKSKADLVNLVLERAADKLGDITPLVLERFYARFPDARQAFATLWPGQQSVLEGEMIDRSIYCLMQWFESPGEIEIMLMGSVPHHAGTLQVEPAWYGGLLQETLDAVAETIPARCVDEKLVWDELHNELLGLVSESAQHG
jgi:hypothetical protein